MIISVDIEKALQIQCMFMIKSLGIENVPKHNAIYNKPTANIILNDERSETRQRCSLS